MPLNVKRLFCSVLLTTILSASALSAFAQTSADVMRERVAKAKAYIATRNYGAAIYELENIRRETNDQTVHGVVNVLLINSFLEQGDYKRAQDFLTELSKKPGASASYLAAAGQVVKGAKNQMERYRSLGLSVSDPKLPKDAVADVDKMRETLEKVVEQTKILSKDKAQTSNAMALMEEATVARGGLARDTFDANRWKNEAADAREDLANSRSVIVNAVGENTVTATTPTDVVASNSTQQQQTTPPKIEVNSAPPTTAPAAEKQIVAQTEPPKTISGNADQPKLELKKVEAAPAAVTENKNLPSRTRRVEDAPVVAQNKTETPVVTAPVNREKNDDSPLAVGSLINYATQKSSPVYPTIARNMRLTGVVKVELLVDESGEVAQVQNTSGPAMLQRAAIDAAKKWKFKPFTRDGQAIKAAGFVSFNFSL